MKITLSYRPGNRCNNRLFSFQNTKRVYKRLYFSQRFVINKLPQIISRGYLQMGANTTGEIKDVIDERYTLFEALRPKTTHCVLPDTACNLPNAKVRHNVLQRSLIVPICCLRYQKFRKTMTRLIRAVKISHTGQSTLFLYTVSSLVYVNIQLHIYNQLVQSFYTSIKTET